MVSQTVVQSRSSTADLGRSEEHLKSEKSFGCCVKSRTCIILVTASTLSLLPSEAFTPIFQRMLSYRTADHTLNETHSMQIAYVMEMFAQWTRPVSSTYMYAVSRHGSSPIFRVFKTHPTTYFQDMQHSRLQRRLRRIYVVQRRYGHPNTIHQPYHKTSRLKQ